MKRKIYFSILILAALSCSRETLIEDSCPVPEGERLTFAADLDNTLKSHLASNGTTLEWDADDRVYVSSAHAQDDGGNTLVGASKWGSSVTEIMPVKIEDENFPSRATFLSGKNRSAWVDDGDGKYSFYALYPASATSLESSTAAPFFDEGNALWVPVNIPFSQDGKHFGKYQVCADFTGTPYSRETILDNTSTIQFNNFQPKTALLSFNATSPVGDVSIERIEISASWADGESHGGFAPQLSGTAFISENGDISNGWDYGGSNSIQVRLDAPITIGTTAGERILAAIIPTTPSSGSVDLKFLAFDVDGNPRLEGSITSEGGFLSGKKYTFTVAMDEAETTVLSFDGKRNFPPEGGSYTARIISYTYNQGTRTKVPFTVQFFADADCATPANVSSFDYWIHLTTDPDDLVLSDDGVMTIEYGVNANRNIEGISPVQDATVGIRSKLLSGVWGEKPDKPWNLASLDGTLNTSSFNSANCYIVNHPGYYLLPCVAGNGIKGGTFNASAYSYTMDPELEVPMFVDYLGNQMENPMIGYTSAGSGTPSAAYLLWEDCANLITTDSQYALTVASDHPKYVELEAWKDYALEIIQDPDTGMWGILFEITSENINQGNAVIAVVDENGLVMWSWHIWVTDYNPYHDLIEVTSYWSEGDYGFMKRNLGWVMTGTSDEITYASNSVYAKIIQEGENGKTIVVPMIQSGQYVENAGIQYGYGPYWQAGRKDPLPPGIRNASDGYFYNAPIYGAVKASTQKDFVKICDNQARLKDAIQHPYIYYYRTSNGGWFSDSITEDRSLWNNLTSIVDEDDASTLAGLISTPEPYCKTVYDPNPAGFVMPPMDAGGTFFAFFVGGKYENYLETLAGDEGLDLRAKYRSLLISASEYGSSYYASAEAADADDRTMTGFLPQVGRRYYKLDGEFLQSDDFFLGLGGVLSGSSLEVYVNEMANSKNCSGYYSNFILPAMSGVLLCAYPQMNFGFLTASSSALPVRSMREER